MAAIRHKGSRTAAPCAAALLLLALAHAACAPPAQDEFRSEGGIAPDPTGVLEGTVLYVGPRPHCEYEGERATRIVGRVLLTLFEYDNPPPPAGTATTAINLFAMSGEQLFRLSDCLPEGAEADPSRTITRSAVFLWPQISLLDQAADYQIRGFYDADEDMNPFFSVTKQPTAGDVVGAALVDPLAASKGLLKVSMPARDRARDGYLRSGVSVTLGSYVWTERPAFSLAEASRALDAQAVALPAVQTREDFQVCVDDPLLCIDPAETVRSIHCGGADATGCDGPFLEVFTEDGVGKLLPELNVELDFDPARYALISEPIDLLTVRLGAPDLQVPDGKPDPHPLLGASAGVPYYSPAIIMQRRAPASEQVEIEETAAIPSVSMLGSPLLSEDGTGPLKRVFTERLPVALAPIAVVDLNPERRECRVPYVPPGNFNSAYETRVTHCGDLPTGLFSVNVFQGVAGGTAQEVEDAQVSESGWVFEGGSSSGQAWSIPNELGDGEQVGDARALPSQGEPGMVVVHDPQPESSGDCEVALNPLPLVTGGSTDPGEDRDVAFRGLCAPGESLLGETARGVDLVTCLPDYCCEPVRHLCGVELCPLCTAESCPDVPEGLNVRSGPTSIVRVDRDGHAVPDCVPFELPQLCCDAR